MKRSIDVLIVIEDDRLAININESFHQFAPTVKLERALNFNHALKIVKTSSVRLFVLGPLCHLDADSGVHMLTAASPETLVQIIPSAFLEKAPPNEILMKWFQVLCSTFFEKETRNTKEVMIQQKKALASMKEAVFNCDKYLNVTYINRAAENLIGLDMEKALGMSLTSVMTFSFDGDDKEPELSLELLSHDGLVNVVHLDSTLHCQKGKKKRVFNSINLLYDDNGKVDSAVIITRKSDNQYSDLYHQANYDWLTDLPNRALLGERLSRAIKLAMRHHYQVALMFVDLDNFKLVNDSLGHDAGDQLLKSVSKRLIGCIRASDTVSRVGGDEFAILLADIVDFGDCERVAKKILRAFELPHQIGQKAYVIGLSIGISVCPLDATCNTSMYKHADEAMYKAKKNGRNTFEVYCPTMSDTS